MILEKNFLGVFLRIFSALIVFIIFIAGQASSQEFRTITPAPNDRSAALPEAWLGAAPSPVTAGEVVVSIGTNVILDHNPRHYGITGIAVQETGNEPCKIELLGRLLDPAMNDPNRVIGTARLPGCEPGQNNSWRAATLAGLSNQFVREIHTCHGAIKLRPKLQPIVGVQKLKGLSVAALAIDEASGVFVELPMLPCIDRHTPHCFARPNCQAWGNSVACPTGKILTSITVSHYAENNRPPNAFFKIRPHCERLVGPTPRPTENTANPGSPSQATTIRSSTVR